MKLAKDIQTIELLNQFSWRALNCFYKPFSIISENLVKNSSYYYLLFKDYVADFDIFFAKETGIFHTLQFQKLELFDEILEELLLKDRDLCLLTNQYFNVLDTMYKKKHHQHPVILKDFHQKTKEYTIIDENYATSKQGGAIEFIDRRIEKELLYKLCSEISKTSFITPHRVDYDNYMDDSFCYFEFSRHTEDKYHIDCEHIVYSFKELIPTIFTFLNKAQADTHELLKKLEEDPFSTRAVYLSYMKGIKVGLPPLNNLETLFKNHGGIISTKYNNMVIINTLLRTGKMDNRGNEELPYKVQRLLSAYNQFKELFFKVTLSKDSVQYKDDYKKMHEALQDISIKEVEFFEDLLTLDWSLKDIQAPSKYTT